MKKTTLFLCSLILTGIGFSCSTAETNTTIKDYTQYVDPFIGGFENGHTFPGACAPFGMLQPSPVTGAIGWKYCGEYSYADSIIWGFTQTHLNGTGSIDLGDLLIMPVTGNRTRAWDGYRSKFSKENEAASPGYYTVELDEPGVKAEITATTHAAIYRYTYHKADSASMLIDLQHAPSGNEKRYHSNVLECEYNWEDAQTLTGHVKNKAWIEQDYFFVLQFNRPVTERINLPMAETEKGQRIIASFDMKPEDELLVKLALSTASVEGAKKNLNTEIPHWEFDTTHQQVKDEWNSYLSRIDVKGSKEQLLNYYTSFYHLLMQPNEISDVDGMYRNTNDETVKAQGEAFYSTFSLWDTYRAAHPLYTIITPERVDGFITSLLEHGEAQGFLPIWALWGVDNFGMIANHGVPVVVEAYRKGFKGFDAERAYNMVKASQTVPHKRKSYWDMYMKYGYYPTDLMDTESVSYTLECVYDDYAAAVMAKDMGKTEDAEYFGKRANFYKNLFDTETQFMRPRKADGSWRAPFNPSAVGHYQTGGDYTEGNAWQYTWHVQHDVPGLIELFGGADKFKTKLDSLFTVELQTNAVDVTGLIGQYAHGNEPSHHVVYMYTIAGYPERAQELIREIFDTQYKPEPDGLCGNDDCGQMSAWYMFSAMGFYPVDPVSCNYVFGAPQIPQITLNLNNGKTFTVIAENLSKENKYVESITFNGQPYTKNYITHEDVMNGGTLVFKMKK